jgi:hypothetical protein
MKTLIAMAVLVVASSAHADGVAGVYDIKLEEMANNCSTPPIAMRAGTLRLEVKQKSLTANIETIPQMNGVASNNNKIEAKTPKVAPTTVQGLDAKYSIGGRLSDAGMLDLVLVAEYSTKGKPYCTQSWRVSGQKSTDAPKK